MVPDVAQPVTNELIGTSVMFHWVQPDPRGAPVVAYNVYVQILNGSFVLSS